MLVLDTLVELVTRGRCIPVPLSSLPRLELLVAEVHAWRECAAKTFLAESSPYSLLEVSLRPARHKALPATLREHTSLTCRGGTGVALRSVSHSSQQGQGDSRERLAKRPFSVLRVPWGQPLCFARTVTVAALRAVLGLLASAMLGPLHQ